MSHIGEMKRIPMNPSGRRAVYIRSGRIGAMAKKQIAAGELPSDWADRQLVMLLAAEQASQPSDRYDDIQEDITRDGCLRVAEPDYETSYALSHMWEGQRHAS